MADLQPLSSPKALRMRLSEVGAGRRFALAADEEARLSLARRLAVQGIERFEGEGTVEPWFDGVLVSARWTARVVQTCGVSLEEFATELSGAFETRLAPEGSPYAPAPAVEVVLDPDAEDPPELLESGMVEVGQLLIEHLAVEIDPYPRKPGAVFEPLPPETPASPFAVLKRPGA